ncbi:hypothetical protein F5148DRAFT_1377423, partial [Russula earlei]
MSTLQVLHLGFQSPQSRPDPTTRPRPPLARSVLPALAVLLFRGVHEYFEDLLTQIEAPLKRNATLSMALDFVVPQLNQLFSRAEPFKTCDRAFVYTSCDNVRRRCHMGQLKCVSQLGGSQIRVQ